MKSSAVVKYAYCTCKAGKGGWCNHMYALRPCGWTVPCKRSANVSKPMDTAVHKVKLEAKGIACNLFQDARAEHLKQLDFNSFRQCQIQLSNVNPMIPFVNSIRNGRDVLSTDLTETKYGKYSIFSPLSWQVPIYGENFNIYCSVDPMIGHEVTNLNQEYPSFPHEDVPIYYDASHQQLKDEELLIYDDLDLTISDSWTLERDTRAQANSLIWMEQRKNRVTASKFYDVYSWKRGMEKHAENFVAGTPTPSAFLQRRFDHGRMYEPIAWKKYYEYFASLGENVKVLPCGLVVNVNNRWLGCSPDAKLMFHNKIGIGESKCPYEHRDSDLMDVAMSNKNFYLQVVGSNLHSKHEHSYYFQVQCQLALTAAAFIQ